MAHNALKKRQHLYKAENKLTLQNLPSDLHRAHTRSLLKTANQPSAAAAVGQDIEAARPTLLEAEARGS